jgi:hypothetical protein
LRETKEETIKLVTLRARKGKWEVGIYFRKENIQADYQKDEKKVSLS